MGGEAGRYWENPEGAGDIEEAACRLPGSWIPDLNVTFNPRRAGVRCVRGIGLHRTPGAEWVTAAWPHRGGPGCPLQHQMVL